MSEPRDDVAGVHPTHYVVLCTVPDAGVGSALARSLVQQKLAACVNRVPGLTSVYVWEGEVHEDSEELLVIKTDEERVPRVFATIEAEHPYDCPEALALAVRAGSLPYLKWITDCLE